MAGSRGLQRTVGVLFMVLSMIVSNCHQVRGQTLLSDNTFAIVSVQCFAFAGSDVQNNYGLWWMQQSALSTLVFNAVDSSTTEIDCHFVSLANSAHQWFPVYKTSGLAVACGADCQWTIEDGGFFLHDPSANTDVQVYSWLAPPDSWTAPV